MFKKSACLLVIAGMLAACGGGGGSSSNTSAGKPVISKKNQINVDLDRITEEIDNGKDYVVNLYDSNGKAHRFVLSVNNPDLGLIEEGASHMTVADLGGALIAVIPEKDGVATIGVSMANETSIRDMNALANSSNPVATYSGVAAGMSGLSIDKPFREGKANFTVDFSNKTLNGKLKGVDSAFDGGIDINAKIEGAKFAGQATSAGGKKAETYGQFAGPKASELHGYYQGKDIAGAYSANKD